MMTHKNADFVQNLHDIHPLDGQPAFQKPALSEPTKRNAIKR